MVPSPRSKSRSRKPLRPARRPAPKAASRKAAKARAPSKKRPSRPIPKRPAPSASRKASPRPTAKAPPPEPAVEPPRTGDARRHLLSLSFLRDGDEFLARLETDGGQITELKNRSLDQLLTLVAGELEDLLE